MTSIDKQSFKVKTEIEKPINSTHNETYVIHEVNEDDENGDDEYLNSNSIKAKQQLQFNPEQINTLSTNWAEKFKTYQELTEYDIMINSIIKENTY